MNIEKLHPPCFYDELQERKLHLEKIILELEHSVKNAPQKTIYTSKSNGVFQFYIFNGQTRKKKYYEKKSAELHQLCQAEYNRLELKNFQKELKAITKLLTVYKNQRKINFPKRIFITPVVLTNEEYKKQWLKIPFASKEKLPDQIYFETSQGLQVRSKSEVMIAEMLSAQKIPFRYEEKIHCQNFELHPDFCCLNVRTRQEIIWEHFGMMDDGTYSQNAIKKLLTYDNNGFELGKNFIFTVETKNAPLNTKKIQKIIKNYLL